MQSYELKLSDGKVEVIEKGAGREVPYSIRHMGIYLVVDTEVGLLLLWDKKTSIFIRLSPEFKVRPWSRTAALTPRPRAGWKQGAWGRGRETEKDRETGRDRERDGDRDEARQRGRPDPSLASREVGRPRPFAGCVSVLWLPNELSQAAGSFSRALGHWKSSPGVPGLCSLQRL